MLNSPKLVNLSFNSSELSGIPTLPSSKSESNRALMLHAYSHGNVKIGNLSHSDDTQVLEKILTSDSPILDAGHAGTAFQFLTTYLAINRSQVVLTGSDRMKNRPIGILVDALRKLGARIDYLEKSGFPPLRFLGFVANPQNVLEIDPSVSSQYISSLVMAAPTFSNGLEIQFTRDSIVSDSYIHLTLSMMGKMGIQFEVDQYGIRIPNQKFEPTTFDIESDWSSASYLLAFAVLAKNSQLEMANLNPNSFQGDSIICEILKRFGLTFEFSINGLIVQNIGQKDKLGHLDLDLSSTPDLAQTILALCSVTGTSCTLRGLKTLAIKETNRLAAMKTELAKMDVILEVNESDGTCYLAENQILNPPNEPLETYQDHRMAMALSLFSMKFPIDICNPKVVSKSFPGFWHELKKLGFSVKFS